MHDVVVIIQDLFIFLSALIVAFFALVFMISRLPEHNPLKRVLTALSLRVCATLLAGVVAVPIEPIPGIDVLYDMGVPILLLFYWATLARSLMQANRPARPPLQGLPRLPGRIE